MTEAVGITAFGAYLPRLRLQRKAMAAANAWANPGIVAQGKGERTMANWDEDAVTMAVEAARDALPASADPIKSRAFVDALYFASTTMPFADRQNAGIVASALSLSEEIHSADVTGSQRAGVSALLAGAEAVKSGASKAALVATGDRRKTRAGAVQEFQYGDGAAAFVFGTQNIAAKLLGSSSVSVDFVDHFRGEGEEFDYGWEERWIRDEGFTKIVPRAVRALLKKTGVATSAIDHFILPCLFPKLDQQIAKICDIDPAKVRDNLGATVGECGTSHALVMLAAALEEAKPGQKILVAAFGQGCDAALFEVTDAIEKARPRRGVKGSLARRKEETNYLKWLAFNGLVEMEKGMRAEKDNKTALSVTYRKRDMLFGLVGGKCEKCGTAQFPRTRICVNPNCRAVDQQVPFSFAELSGKILSWSADYLTYSQDPPSHYGMVTFEEGGRFLSDITDVDIGTIDTGTKVRMAFRIKDFDDRRGFRRYFWKAVPVAEVIRTFLGRPRGINIATLVLFAWTYGFFILNIMPQWHELQLAQGGQDLQGRFVGAKEIGDTLAGFDAHLKQSALIFYAIDVPNFLLLAAAGAAVCGFGLRNLGSDRFPYAWVIALPLAAGAMDALENATLAAALLTTPREPMLNAVSALAISLKLSLLFAAGPVVTFMALAELTAWAWRRIGGSIAPRS